ncbi:SUMF1/EgtB/PvdO family nonheme iron enzyme [Flammeovirga sp. SubArs3]|uniref:SUMF1/EgtB/PvdO family nonheme iron enzyme n=1 Tax=Flammeovirga sp. SubArs3 TaxID=2995316 RepID=UPI00248BB6C8|nr:SUMF1/EgtB/PvdO family nonheme iron enzyme [Flammeovirga sp. SubArs3]
MKHLSLLYIFVFWTTNLIAQEPELAVVNFQELTQDMEARIKSPLEDQNGERCAIVKVVTSEKNFEFEGDGNGIVKVLPKSGEYWVYIPEGSKRLTIKHPNLGILRNYIYPHKIKEATTYEMILKSGKVRVIVEEEEKKFQLVTFKTVNSGADIYINNEYYGQTPKVILLEFGKYNYSLKRPLYQPISKELVIDKEFSVELAHELTPDYGSIRLITPAIEGAEIYIDDKPTGLKTPGLVDYLEIGKHTITVRHPDFLPFTQEVEILEPKEYDLSVDLKPHFGFLSLKTLKGATIRINGTIIKYDNCISLSTGKYIVEVSKPSYKTSVETIAITNSDTTFLNLQPSIKKGKLLVNCSPSSNQSQLYIDNRLIGHLPYEGDITEGEHLIKVLQEGYGSKEEVIYINDNEKKVLNLTIIKGEYLTAQNTISQIDVAIPGNLFIEMVKIPKGEFIMGNKKGDPDEKDEKRVDVEEFYMGKFEVTQEQWWSIMGKKPSFFKGEKFPVETVSWNEVQKFIQRLNQLTNKKFRLPSEEEWEYVARAQQKFTYSGGIDLTSVGWYRGNSNGTTHKVGTKFKNRYGIYDMNGNVWEWCNNDYSPSYAYHEISNPTPEKVLRGGGWKASENGCRNTNRFKAASTVKANNIGFRLVCD